MRFDYANHISLISHCNFDWSVANDSGSWCRMVSSTGDSVMHLFRLYRVIPVPVAQWRLFSGPERNLCVILSAWPFSADPERV